MNPSARLGVGLAVEGTFREVVVPSPVAGAEWSLVLPSGYNWLVALGQATLLASGVVATRLPGFRIANGDNVPFYTAQSGTSLAAGLTQTVSYATDGAQAPGGAGAVNVIDVPEVMLPGGWRIGSSTGAIDVGDQYSAIRLYLLQLYDESPSVAAGSIHHPHLTIDLEAHHAA
jgi:hypothetical protein